MNNTATIRIASEASGPDTLLNVFDGDDFEVSTLNDGSLSVQLDGGTLESRGDLVITFRGDRAAWRKAQGFA